MIAKLRGLLNRHRQIICYVFFGVLTTLVNFIVYYSLYNLCVVSATLSNILAWIAAVLFAFLTNKHFVFKSRDWSCPVVLPEFLKFAACRLASGLIETLALFVIVDCLRGDGNIWKAIISLVVIVLNYVGSKLFVFQN